MVQVGLTGGIGSGKSLVSSIFEKLGVPVYNADARARMLMNSDPALIGGIRRMFGEAAYGNEGLNRTYIAGLVFGDEEKLRALNRLVHPAVRTDYLNWTGQQTGSPYVLEEAAILFESGADQEMDLTVLVYAPEELRIKRVMERDGVSREAVQSRMGHQLSDEELKKRVDHVLMNDGTGMLLPQVIELHTKILNRKE